MLDWSTCQVVEHDPGTLSGATLDQFLAWFPGVTRAQAEAVLEHAARSLQPA